jgi:MFS family permease
MIDIGVRAKETNYRWIILTLGAFTNTIVVAIPSMAMPVLFKEISDDLGLGLVQIGAIWGMGSLSGILTSLIGGTIGDRYGTKRTLMITCLLTGATGALRGFSKDFPTLSLTILLNGFVSPAIATNVHKTCGIWFSKKQLGLANGIVSMGMALGFTIGSLISANVMSPLLGGWRNVLILYGILAMVIGFIWYFARGAPDGFHTSVSKDGATSLPQAFSKVIKIRRVWSLGLALMCFNGCIQGTLGYLPLYLREIGWPASNADGALASFHALSMVFVIPLAVLSDRIGMRKPILVAGAMVTTIGVGLLSIVEGSNVWILVMMVGLFRDGFMAVFITTVIETKSVGIDFAGTAVGLTLLLSSLGSLLSPPIGNSLAEMNLSYPFRFWASLAALASFAFLWLKEARA